jgi:hypothetical protein
MIWWCKKYSDKLIKIYQSNPSRMVGVPFYWASKNSPFGWVYVGY